MSIFDLAIDLKKAGWSDNEIRDELRSSITTYGEFPTCSSVEEALGLANKSIQKDAE